MWKLTIEDDEGKQTSLPLAHEEYGVGRGDDNAIRLTDRNISRKHAKLAKNGQGWVVHDLESYNGTYVNGTRVTAEQAIAPGDVVQLGDYRLEVVDEASVAAVAVPEAQVVGVDPFAAQAGAMPAGAQQRPNRLVMVVGPTPGAEFPLDTDRVMLGRAEEATVSINHSSVSRLHAELVSIGNGRFEVFDKQSANGIRINGVDLKRGILEAGDALEVGDVRLRYVGAGKIFRADQSQQLPVVAVPFESVAPSVRAPAPLPMASSGNSIAKIAGIGAVVGVLAIVGLLLAMDSDPVPTTAASPETTGSMAAGEVILEQAKGLLAERDYEGAHRKVMQIPEGASARNDETFLVIEAAWADSIFEKVEAESDPVEKRKLLNMVASTGSVDAERRRKAVEMITELDATSPPPKTETPPAVAGGPEPTATGGTTAPPSAATTAGTTAAPTSTTPPAATTVAKTDPTPVPSVPAQGPPDEAAMRRALEGKVWSGKGTIQDIKMLRAICSHQGDRACRDRATAMLKQKEAGG